MLDTQLDMVSIYGLVDPRTHEVRYVGKARDPELRFRQHLRPSQLNYCKTKKNSWLKSLLAQGLRPELTILATVPPDEADRAEKFYIYLQYELGCDLTNGTRGGDGGGTTDPDARARIVAAHRGRKASDETRAKMSATHTAAKASPEARERMRQSALKAGTAKTLPVMKGEANPRTNLSDAQVREIRVRESQGETPTTLAGVYGITPASVTQIVTGQTRVDAGGPIREARQRRRLSVDDVAEIRRLVAGGANQTEVARQFGIHSSHVSKIKSNARCLDKD